MDIVNRKEFLDIMNDNPNAPKLKYRLSSDVVKLYHTFWKLDRIYGSDGWIYEMQLEYSDIDQMFITFTFNVYNGGKFQEYNFKTSTRKIWAPLDIVYENSSLHNLCYWNYSTSIYWLLTGYEHSVYYMRYVILSHTI